MAEGGTPQEGTSREESQKEEEYDYPKYTWDRGALEYVFASDLIHVVIERYDHGWKSHDYLSHRSAVTPFNTEIQRVVEGILKKDSFYLEKVFEQLVNHCGELSLLRFNMCAVFMRLHYNKTFDSFHALLNYFCIIGHFAAWSQKRGLRMAPFFAIDIILAYIREFLSEHNIASLDAFWYHLERDAGNALSLPKVVMLHEEQLEHLPGVMTRMERLSEETPTESSSVEESSEKPQEQASEMEKSTKNDEPEKGDLKLLPDKKESKSSNIECSVDVHEVQLPAERTESASVEPAAEGTESASLKAAAEATDAATLKAAAEATDAATLKAAAEATDAATLKAAAKGTDAASLKAATKQIQKK